MLCWIFGMGYIYEHTSLFSCRWQALKVNLNHSYLPRFLYNIDRIEFIELKTFYRWDVRSPLKFSRRLFTFKHLVLLCWKDSTYVFLFFLLWIENAEPIQENSTHQNCDMKTNLIPSFRQWYSICFFAFYNLLFLYFD